MQDPFEAPSDRKAIAVSEWSAGRTIAIGDESQEEWLIYDGETMEPTQ